MSAEPAIEIAAALKAALAAGESVRGTTSPNPPVGAAIVDRQGTLVGVGATQPAGQAHAEIMALNAAGSRAKGASAVVTLEPCNHTGRTGPCAQALVEAGISRVFYLHTDPNGAASGGAEYLRRHGVEVIHLSQFRAAALIPWLRATKLGRPHVTLKFAQTLDGFSAASDGSSQWITGEAARAHVHADRSLRDAIIVGTSTALVDRPRLTARREDGSLYPTQPRRVVIGARSVDLAGFEQYPDPRAALEALWNSGARDVLVEGGAGLATSFLQADLVDALQAYIAPGLLGAGRSVLAAPLGDNLADMRRMRTVSVRQLGEDVLMELAVLDDKGE